MLTLVPGAMGGSETYAAALREELSGLGLCVSSLLPGHAAGWTGGGVEELVPGFRAGSSDSARAVRVLLGLARGRTLSRRLEAVDLVHYPFTVPVPRVARGTPTVVTLHDMQHRDLPTLFSPAERAYRRIAYERAAARADAVITVSDFCKAAIVDATGVDPARVHVVPLGVRPTTPLSEAAPEPMLLYPARGWPHKNHRVLFEAFGILRRTRPGLRLVLTGSQPGEIGPVPAGVQDLGRIDRVELDRLYARAAALVFPSLYEGFGLPVLEAMAAGCPVAASDLPPLREIAQESAVYFNPRDPQDMARAVDQALRDRAQLVVSGRARSADFTWERCARAHLRVYESVRR